MMLRFGVEMAEVNDKYPGATAQVVKRIAQEVNILDRDERLYIVTTREEAEKLIRLFQDKGMFEEEYELFELSQGEITDDFNDYGFTGLTGKHYLYKDMTIPFTLGETKDPKQKEMAFHQMAEHVIAKDSADSIVYFADRQQRELIERIGTAYGVVVSF